MLELTQSQLQTFWVLLKLSLPLAIGWTVSVMIRSRNPRWRVATWRTTGLAAGMTIFAVSMPPLSSWELPVSRDNVPALSISQSVVMPDDSPTTAVVMQLAPRESSNLEVLSTPVAVLPKQSVRSVAPVLNIDPVPTSIAAEEPDFRSSSSIGRVCLAVYLVVISALLLREITAKIFARRLIRRSQSYSSSDTETLTARLGLFRVPIRISDEISSPCVLGWWRPTVVLPRFLSNDDVRSAIAHELAHVASGDLRWDVFIRLIGALLWPHPLVWRMVAAHRASCESVSDLVAADLLEDRATYRSSLARIALAVQSWPHSAARGELRAGSMPMARRPEIIDRLRIIASDLQATPLSRRAKSMAALAILGVTIVGTSSLVLVPTSARAVPPPNQASKTEAAPTGTTNPIASDATFAPKLGTFNVQAVANPSGKPLAGAKFELMICTTSCRGETVTADNDGRWIFELAPGAEKYSIIGQIYSPGFVPGHFRVDNIHREGEPLSLTIRMDPGFVASGIIVDEDGNPVEGAKIRGSIHADPVGYSIFSQETDVQGRWEMDSVAEATLVTIEHDRFTNTSFRVVDKTTSRLQLDRGRTVRILVQDPSGQPVPGAQVEFDPGETGTVQTMMTDREGRFEKQGLPDKPLSIQISSPRFIPLVHEVPDDNRGEVIQVRLHQGRQFELLVVDEAKRPIPNAYARIAAKRPFRTSWQGESDASGVITWEGATGEIEPISISAKGFIPLERDVDTSQAMEMELQTAPTLRGQVVDANTDGKIDEFVVRVVRSDYPDRAIGSASQTTGRGGEFDLTLASERDGFSLAVIAAGYQQWLVPLVQINVAEPISVRLETAAKLSGRVLDPDGKPAAGVKLILTDSTLMMPFPAQGYFMNREKDSFRPLEVQSSGDGTFVFNLEAVLPATTVIFVEDRQGFTNTPLKMFQGTHDVQLERWTSLEVIAKQEATPIPRLSVTVRYVDYGYHDGIVRPRELTRVTDAEGRAVFEQVRPWDVYVETKTPGTDLSNGGSANDSKRTKLLPTPNQLVLNRGGVRLEGQIVIPPDPQGMRLPAFDDQGSIDGTSLDGEPKRILFKPDGQGHFVIESLSSGNYIIRLPIGTQVPRNHSGTGVWMAELNHYFQVPENATSPYPLTVNQSWSRIPDVGDDALPFVGELARGGQISSRELAGKWLLLDWWSSESKLYEQQLPQLLQAVPRWENEGLQVLSIAAHWSMRSSDAGPTIAGDWESIPWPMLADYSACGLMRQGYAAGISPTRILINPEGKIVYRGSDWESLEKIVDKSLASHVQPNLKSPFAGLKAKIFDDAAELTTPVAVATIENKMLPLDPSKAGQHRRSRALKLFSSDGELLKSIDLGILVQDFPRRRMVVDRERERLYVVKESDVIAVSRFGKQLFQTQLPNLKSIALDEKAGELWCSCGDFQSGVTVVLDQHGNESRRFPFATADLIYSPQEDGFWSVGRDLRLLGRDGNVLRVQDSVHDALFVEDSLVDTRGKVWVIIMDRPEGKFGSRTALWRQGENGWEIVHPFVAEFDSKSGKYVDGSLHAFQLSLDGDEILVKSVPRDAAMTWKHLPRTERLTLEGKSLGLRDSEPTATQVSKAGGWAVHENVLQRMSKDFDVLESFIIGEPHNDSNELKTSWERPEAFE